MPIQTYALDIPVYYQNIAETKYMRKPPSMLYQTGDVYYVHAGYGKVYYKVDDDGLSYVCTPDGETVSYDEVQQYFGLSVASDQNENNQQTEEEVSNQQTKQIQTEENEAWNQDSQGEEETRKDLESKIKKSGDFTLGRKLGDISMGNHPLAPYYGSDIIVPRPAKSQYPAVAKTVGNSKFSDIRGHWAEAEIKGFASSGYISGDPDGRFRPDDPISYAEFVSIVARFELKPVRWHGGYLNSFLFQFSSSVNENDWYYNACMVASEAGLFGNIRKFETDKGTEWNGQTAFSLPALTEPAQRQHIAQFAVNLLGYKKSDLDTKLNYSDEQNINRYSNGVIYDAVKRLVSNDIISGYPDGSFRPQGTITRAELVVMLTKILDKYNWDMDTISNNMYGNYNLWNWEQDKLLGDLVNEARNEAGQKPLIIDKDLQALTAIRVIEKSVYGKDSGSGAHQSQFFGTIQNMADSFGYDGLIGENAHFSRSTAISAHDSLMNSEAHKKNLLNYKYQYGGFAVGEDCAYEMFSY